MKEGGKLNFNIQSVSHWQHMCKTMEPEQVVSRKGKRSLCILITTTKIYELRQSVCRWPMTHLVHVRTNGSSNNNQHFHLVSLIFPISLLSTLTTADIDREKSPSTPFGSARFECITYTECGAERQPRLSELPNWSQFSNLAVRPTEDEARLGKSTFDMRHEPEWDLNSGGINCGSLQQWGRRGTVPFFRATWG